MLFWFCIVNHIYISYQSSSLPFFPSHCWSKFLESQISNLTCMNYVQKKRTTHILFLHWKSNIVSSVAEVATNVLHCQVVLLSPFCPVHLKPAGWLHCFHDPHTTTFVVFFSSSSDSLEVCFGSLSCCRTDLWPATVGVDQRILHGPAGCCGSSLYPANEPHTIILPSSSMLSCRRRVCETCRSYWQ